MGYTVLSGHIHTCASSNYFKYEWILIVCTVLSCCIHTFSWSNFCDYNARNGSGNRNSWVNRKCDGTIRREWDTCEQIYCKRGETYICEFCVNKAQRFVNVKELVAELDTEVCEC